MELLSVYVNGYRNVSDTKVNLSDISSILSLNNYGKSNLLSSIVFGLSFIQHPQKTKQMMMNDVKCIPTLKSYENKYFKFEIECMDFIDDLKVFINYSYEFEWGHPEEKVNGKIIKECLKMKIDDSLPTTYIKREYDNKLYKPSKTSRCSSKIIIEDDDLILNKLKAYDSLYYHFIIKNLLNVNVYIDRHFDTEFGYGITFMSEQELTDLTLKPELHIPKTLYKLKSDYPDKYELLVNVFMSLFPSIKSLQIEELSQRISKTIKLTSNNEVQELSDKIYVLFVRDKNLKYGINFQAMSDGARRILLLLTFIVVAQINGFNLICIEEPENSIHPSLLRKFLYSISELADETKLLFSSHSPYLINYMQPENVYLGIPNDYGLAEFKKIKTSTNAKKRLMKNIVDSNMQLGDYLFDLMSGSTNDKEELLSYVE